MSAVLSVEPLGFPWKTFDPFLFCAHHDDHYPKGNEQMGPAASLEGRRIGMDFGRKDGWSMYHGEQVPGFPQHPHRGFETVTLVRDGFIDHSDSMGATARFGNGDVQWMTAGKGVVHCEMFPLRSREKDNPVELFQVWLNLPRRDKMVEPYFTMLWGEAIPRHVFTDDAGRETEVVTVAGKLVDGEMPAPPPDSWAGDPRNQVAIWTIKLAPGAKWTMPSAGPGVNRGLYFFKGSSIRVDGQKIPASSGMRVQGDAPIALENGPDESELLLLQGRAIAEPVVHHGPFVMNTREEIQQAFADYRATQFGGWPWPGPDPVHPREQGRFALHATGKREEPA